MCILLVLQHFLEYCFTFVGLKKKNGHLFERKKFVFFVGLKNKPDIYLIGHLFDRSRYEKILTIFLTNLIVRIFRHAEMRVPHSGKHFFNPPMPDSKSAQNWYFFSILEINNFLGFQNVFPKLYEPS